MAATATLKAEEEITRAGLGRLARNHSIRAPFRAWPRRHYVVGRPYSGHENPVKIFRPDISPRTSISAGSGSLAAHSVANGQLSVALRSGGGRGLALAAGAAHPVAGLKGVKAFSSPRSAGRSSGQWRSSTDDIVVSSIQRIPIGLYTCGV